MEEKSKIIERLDRIVDTLEKIAGAIEKRNKILEQELTEENEEEELEIIKE